MVIGIVVTLMFALMIRSLAFLAESIGGNISLKVFSRSFKEPHKVYLYIILSGIVSASTGVISMNLSSALSSSRGFNVYSFIGGLFEVWGIVLFL